MTIDSNNYYLCLYAKPTHRIFAMTVFPPILEMEI